VRVEAVLRREQDLGRFESGPTPHQVVEILEPLDDAGGGDHRRSRTGTVVCGVGVHDAGRDDHQVARPCGQHLLPGEHVQDAVEDVERLGERVVPVWHRTVRSRGEVDPVGC